MVAMLLPAVLARSGPSKMFQEDGSSCAGATVAYLPSVTTHAGTFSGCVLSSANRKNVVCDPASSNPKRQCPSACDAKAPSPRSAQRLRRAVHTLTGEEWQRVVMAMWALRTTPTEAGREIFGPAYRGYEYFTHLHALATQPPYDPTLPCHHNLTSCSEADRAVDVTSGGPQLLMWLGLFALEFETSLLLVDPEIGGLPYVDWAASAADAATWYARAGVPTCAPVDPGCKWQPTADMCVLDQGPFQNWPVMMEANVTALQAIEPTWAADERLDGSPGRTAWADAKGLNTSADSPMLLLRSRANLTRDYCNGSAAARAASANRSVDSCTANWRAKVAAEVQLCVEGLPASAKFLELAACYEGRLAANKLKDCNEGAAAVPSLHGLLHRAAGPLALGGYLTGPEAVNDPIFWLHAASADRLRLEWQSRQPARVRRVAYGYPVKAAYDVTRVGLYDCVGCGAYGLGFGLAEGGGGGGGAAAARNLSAADVLCGPLESLYTYDTVLARHNDWLYTKLLQPTVVELLWGILMGMAGVMLLYATLVLLCSRLARRGAQLLRLDRIRRSFYSQPYEADAQDRYAGGLKDWGYDLRPNSAAGAGKRGGGEEAYPVGDAYPVIELAPNDGRIVLQTQASFAARGVAPFAPPPASKPSKRYAKCRPDEPPNEPPPAAPEASVEQFAPFRREVEATLDPATGAAPSPPSKPPRHCAANGPTPSSSTDNLLGRGGATPSSSIDDSELGSAGWGPTPLGAACGSAAF